jgi:predicted transcriptional regulator
MKQRTTIYLNCDLHRALRKKASATKQPMSRLVREAIKVSLAEDFIDLVALDRRKKEQSLPFEDVVNRL